MNRHTLQVACPRCGRAVADNDRFCGGCGAAIADACRHCGRRLAREVKFCPGCGTARDGGTEPVTGATEDRRRVSVLFVDLVDFTPYAEQSDPELVRRLQSRFYAAVRRVVSQHGGVVEKYIGDAAMALFGAPVATETDTLRCVRAALELQRVLTDQDAGTEGGLGFRVGVATGEALVDVAAARDGGQAIVAGDVVNTASRLQAVAPPGGVLVCSRTHALTATAIRYAAQPEVTLRGRSAPTQVWLAVAPVQRAQGDPEPDATPLVEREHELGLLAGALHRAVRDRTPQLVTIFGLAGIGKTRLVSELRQQTAELVSAPVVWRTGLCRPFGEDVTYAGLSDIVKGHAGILDTDQPGTARTRLRLAVREVVPGPEEDRLVDALEPLVGLPGSGLPAEETESAWRRFLVAIAARSPTVLVFEDLHWADESMLRFIELLPAAARDVPLLVLGTARPELIDRDSTFAGTITGSLTITLPPLRSAGMATLYRHILGQAQPPAASLASLDRSDATFGGDLLRPLVELAGGNPLYAHEYVRMLVQRDAAPVAGLTGGADLPMPDSVHAVIANRVDLLEPADRAVLQAAAVVGMQFWPGAVAAALGRPAGSVERSLRRLEQREFISEQLESSMAGQGEFRFRHVLVRDVCYQRLPRTERVARHERTADWLESLALHRDTDLAEVLAHHRWTVYEIARTLGVPADRYTQPARRALRLAAHRAYALHALDRAERHTARALALLDPDPAGAAAACAAPEPERLGLELFATEIAFYQDRSGFLAGGGAEQLRSLAERLAAAVVAGGQAAAGADREQVTGDAARAWTLLGQVAWLEADRERALSYLDRAVGLFATLPDSGEKVDAYAQLGRLHMTDYECSPAIAAASTAAEIAGRLGLVEAQADARITIATARYETGDPAGLDELLRITELCRTNRLLALRRATRNLSHVVREEGDWRRSEELLSESLRLDGPGGHNVLLDQSGDPMRAYFTGDLDAIDTTSKPSAEAGWELNLDLRAYVRALRGNPVGAAADATAALAAARGTGFHRPLWGALASAALCRALLGQRDLAAELLAELVGGWQKVSVIAGGEWVCKAAQAAALAGPEPAETLRVPLAEQRRHTAWSEAALHTVTGAVALGNDTAGAAARQHLAAAEIHGQIPAVTDRMLALALAAAAFACSGEPAAAEEALAEVRAFAQRTATPVLLQIAEAGSAGHPGG
ncbi:MAG: AAA family ATPase [Micromonosporaceae bacterium]|nr:AAA family ATPase [Micromonosporaceae bacterium]